jgi:hypothetical protein
VGLLVARHDLIIDYDDAVALNRTLGSAVVKYSEINGGHVTFLVAKDASFIYTDILPTVASWQYMPIP